MQSEAREHLEKPGDSHPLRETLEQESLHFLKETTQEDSDAYAHASTAVGSIISRSMGAARRIEEELQKNIKLPEGDTRRLTAEEIQDYHAFLTQTEAWAIILPRLLQQTRIVQYQPEVQGRLKAIFELIADREAHIENLEVGRSAILHQGTRQKEPLRPTEIQELVPIATVAWIIRSKLAPRATLTDAQRKQWESFLETVLPEGEERYREKTHAMGDALNRTGAIANAERRKKGAERITQGLPRAELILDTPELSIAVWERLLIEGGPSERTRASRQLSNAILRFQQDFTKLGAYEEFAEEAREALEEHIRKNEGIGNWFDHLHIPGREILKNRMLTPEKELQAIYDETMEKVRERFEDIASAPDAKMTDLLRTKLDEIGKGSQVDPVVLRNYLQSYARIQKLAAVLLADIQRWQVGENVDRVGGMGDPNMLDQVTRVQGKRVDSYLRSIAPYGVFRIRSYRDENGRIILVTPEDASTVEYQLKEGAKASLLVSAAILTPILHRLATRVPLLGERLFGRWYARLGVPLTAAGFSIVGAKAGSDVLVVRQAVKGVMLSVDQLEQTGIPLPPSIVKKQADEIFQHLVTALHAAEGKRPGSRDHELALEAHLYTNEILMALGYPPYHEIAPESMPGKSDETMSPEIRNYLSVKKSERAGINQEARTKLKDLREEIPQTPEDALAEARLTASPAEALLRSNTLPDAFSKQEMLNILQQAMKTREFPGVSLNEEAAQQIAGDTHLTLMRLWTLEHLARKRHGAKYSGREDIDEFQNEDPVGPLMGGGRFSLRDAERDVQRLVHETDPLTILAAARLLNEQPPSNKEISSRWFGKEYPGGFGRWFTGFDRKIAARFGKPEKRGNTGTKFLREWVDLWDYGQFLGEGE